VGPTNATGVGVEVICPDHSLLEGPFRDLSTARILEVLQSIGVGNKNHVKCGAQLGKNSGPQTKIGGKILSCGFGYEIMGYPNEGGKGYPFERRRSSRSNSKDRDDLEEAKENPAELFSLGMHWEDMGALRACRSDSYSAPGYVTGDFERKLEDCVLDGVPTLEEEEMVVK